MPRLFTALPVPASIGEQLALHRGGVAGARWIDPADYHVTLRFFGDIDGATARDLAVLLGEARRAGPLTVALDALSTFGGDRPRAVIARVVPTPELARVQAEQEKLARQVGLDPEGRKYTPHVTLARLRAARASDVAAFLARAGHFPPLRFEVDRVVLYSARDSVGGGPYRIEAAYPLAPFGRSPPPSGMETFSRSL